MTESVIYKTNYEVFENGDIYSIARTIAYKKGLRKINRRKLKHVIHSAGYITVSIGRNKEYLHRILYSCFKGNLKKGLVVDHKDNNPANNSLDNLQQITHRGNLNKDRVFKNGCPGVRFIKNKWVAKIQIKKVIYSLGTFESKDLAAKAYQIALSNYIDKSILPFKKMPTSGFKNVYFSKNHNKWRAQERVNGKSKHIGIFDTEKEAISAIS